MVHIHIYSPLTLKTHLPAAFSHLKVLNAATGERIGSRRRSQSSGDFRQQSKFSNPNAYKSQQIIDRVLCIYLFIDIVVNVTKYSYKFTNILIISFFFKQYNKRDFYFFTFFVFIMPGFYLYSVCMKNFCFFPHRKNRKMITTTIVPQKTKSASTNL